ncbi:MAG TPA: hypothetical protein DEQ64_03200, partial [Lachnoclostridium sp.]|nr:hypothetical protein [Lachnoclostridium sp.]
GNGGSGGSGGSGSSGNGSGGSSGSGSSGSGGSSGGGGSQKEVVIIPEAVPLGEWEGLQTPKDTNEMDRLPKTGYTGGGLGSAFLFAGNILLVFYLLIGKKPKSEETEQEL